MDREKMTVSARVVPAREVYEINTYEQLRELDEESKAAQLRKFCRRIAGALDCEVRMESRWGNCAAYTLRKERL